MHQARTLSSVLLSCIACGFSLCFFSTSFWIAHALLRFTSLFRISHPLYSSRSPSRYDATTAARLATACFQRLTIYRHSVAAYSYPITSESQHHSLCPSRCDSISFHRDSTTYQISTPTSTFSASLPHTPPLLCSHGVVNLSAALVAVPSWPLIRRQFVICSPESRS